MTLFKKTIVQILAQQLHPTLSLPNEAAPNLIEPFLLKKLPRKKKSWNLLLIPKSGRKNVNALKISYPLNLATREADLKLRLKRLILDA